MSPEAEHFYRVFEAARQREHARLAALDGDDPFAADPYLLGALLALVKRIVRNSADLTREQNVQLSNALLDAEGIIRARIS